MKACLLIQVFTRALVEDSQVPVRMRTDADLKAVRLPSLCAMDADPESIVAAEAFRVIHWITNGVPNPEDPK
jgi:hypothetical protein